MADEKPPSPDEIKGLIERVDRICRESKQTRNRADHSMRQRPIWPDRRKTPRWSEDPSSSEKRKDTT